MTALRRWRNVARGLTLVSFAGGAVVAVVGLALLILVAVLGGASSPDHLIPLVTILGVYGVGLCAIWNAQGGRAHR